MILDGFRVRGSMDLVEEHRETKALRVVDHKTGKMPEQTAAVRWGAGEFLQPLLYALAGESLWSRPVQSGSLYYCTQRGGYKRIDIQVSDAGRRRLNQVLSTIDDAIERVFLPAAPAKDACKRCDYTSVCGPYEADRSRRKNQEPLEALQSVAGSCHDCAVSGCGRRRAGARADSHQPGREPDRGGVRRHRQNVGAGAAAAERAADRGGEDPEHRRGNVHPQSRGRTETAAPAASGRSPAGRYRSATRSPISKTP